MKKILEFLLGFSVGILLAFLLISAAVDAFAAETEVLSSCGLSEEELEERLKGELKPYAEAFLQAEEDYGINACFIASIAALESGWGKYRIAENNLFGFGKKAFDSEEQAIDYVSWFLYKHYIREDGRYFRGGSIGDIGKIYCPDDGTWVRIVTGIFLDLQYGE